MEESNPAKIPEKIYAVTIAPYSVLIALIEHIMNSDFIIRNNLFIFVFLLSLIQMILGTAIVRAMSGTQTKDIILGMGLFVSILPIFLFHVVGYLILPQYYHLIFELMVMLIAIPLIVFLYEAIKLSREALVKSKLKDKLISIFSTFGKLPLASLTGVIAVILSSAVVIVSSSTMLVAFAILIQIIASLLFYLKHRREKFHQTDTAIEDVRGDQRKDILDDYREYWTLSNGNLQVSNELPNNVRLGLLLLYKYPDVAVASNLADELSLKLPTISQLLFDLKKATIRKKKGVLLSPYGFSWIAEQLALHDRRRIMDDELELEYIYFSSVEKDAYPDQLKKGGIRAPFNIVIKRIYERYLMNIIKCNRSKRCYPLLKSEEGIEDAEEIFSQLRAIDLVDASAEFDMQAEKLVQRFLNLSRGYLPSVIYIVRFRYDGRKYIGLLLLDWVNERFFTFDARRGSVALNEIREEMPAGGKMKKGAIYPHPFDNDAYMKINEKDYPTESFSAVLGGNAPLAPRVLLREITRIGSKLKGTSLNLEGQIGIYDGLLQLGSNRPMITGKEVAWILSTVLPGIPKHTIKKQVATDFTVHGIIDPLEIKNLRFRIYFSNKMRLIGDAQSISDSFFPNEISRGKHSIIGEITGIRII